jgi:hypothetical protein
MSDADLYTGVLPEDAGAFGNEAEPKEQKEEREQQIVDATRLLPSVEVITEVIEKRRRAVRDFDSYYAALGDSPKAADIETEYRARQLHLEFLDSLESDISNRVAQFKEQST